VSIPETAQSEGTRVGVSNYKGRGELALDEDYLRNAAVLAAEIAAKVRSPSPSARQFLNSVR